MEGDESFGASYAERCINLNPQGPFAGAARKILASHAGFSSNDTAHNAIRTIAEIEVIVSASVNDNNPEILEEIFPLVALPDNPYTIYALGILRALAAIPEYRDFFTKGALKSPGRLGERLHYISRG